MGTPVAATKFLKHQSGRVFTTYWWGDYMIYEGIPVFVDGRTDMYFGTDILETYVNVASLVIDPDPVFKRWDIRWVLWNTGTALSVYLSQTPVGKSPTARETMSSTSTSAPGEPGRSAGRLGRIGRCALSGQNGTSLDERH